MIHTYPWVVLSPGIAIFISVVIFNLLEIPSRLPDPKNSRIMMRDSQRLEYAGFQTQFWTLLCCREMKYVSFGKSMLI